MFIQNHMKEIKLDFIRYFYCDKYLHIYTYYVKAIFYLNTLKAYIYLKKTQ